MNFYLCFSLANLVPEHVAEKKLRLWFPIPEEIRALYFQKNIQQSLELFWGGAASEKTLKTIKVYFIPLWAGPAGHISLSSCLSNPSAAFLTWSLSGVNFASQTWGLAMALFLVLPSLSSLFHTSNFYPFLHQLLFTFLNTTFPASQVRLSLQIILQEWESPKDSDKSTGI